LPKTIDLTDFSASERSDIGLMSELCYMFLSQMWRTPHLQNRKINQMRRVFFEELVIVVWLGHAGFWPSWTNTIDRSHL